MPLVKIIEEQDILAEFPGRTEADLYLWIMDHRYYLSQEQGRPVGPKTAVLSYNRSQVIWARKVLGWTKQAPRLHGPPLRGLGPSHVPRHQSKGGA